MIKYIFQVLIFLASIIVIVFEIIEIKKELYKQKRSYMKIIGMLFVLFMVTILGAWGNAFGYITINKEFSNRNKNIELYGKSENICLVADHKIDEVISLKIKDTWAFLQPETDYELRNNNVVFIKFIYCENKTDNRNLANRGLMFTYKTKYFLFNPAYILHCIKQK